ncbi:MAG: hypothetical protein COW59_08440 [Lysobacterales bacterium CG17_big_fil_post_rev_8_21_14_2_50_64_11]|nr:MAG: hypothetical protein COW59_08440 [Xanthomonadales bacterium CG17_big_fil_post_rev_8_21_14_2_50_64_11]PIX60306.1 MAG: hypothetical protein COZ47_07985 [Xanthomonadales bacterium CG_4_10_14_3_um_filter_64_11]
MANADPQSLRQYLHTLADALPDNATTAMALYHLVLRREIEAGMADSDAGRVVPHATVMQRFGLAE